MCKLRGFYFCCCVLQSLIGFLQRLRFTASRRKTLDEVGADQHLLVVDKGPSKRREDAKGMEITDEVEKSTCP